MLLLTVSAHQNCIHKKIVIFHQWIITFLQGSHNYVQYNNMSSNRMNLRSIYYISLELDSMLWSQSADGVTLTVSLHL